MDEIVEYPAHHGEWLLRLGVAAGIGFLIGLDREFAIQREKEVDGKSGHPMGLRTSTLISVLGYLAAMLAEEWGRFMLVGVFFGFALLAAVAYFQSAQKGDQGLTSEITALLLFLLGALSFHGELLVAVVCGVLVLVLLRFKLALHGFVKTLNEEEIVAIVRFVVISALILPFLPDQGYGPDEVWNPREIWMMVVLVSGISLVGYLLSKLFGSRAGAVLSGVLGGLTSSTALSLGHARSSKDGGAIHFLALGVVVACSIMFLRMLAELAVLNPPFAQRMALPLVGSALCGVGVALFLARRAQKSKPKEDRPGYSNPLNFRVALQFAVIYAIVSWLMRFATEQFGTAGRYVAAVLSGATDVDAVTLSTARQAGADITEPAVITLLIAALSNTLVKWTIVITVGNKDLRKAVLPGFAALFAAVGGMILWTLLSAS